MDAGDCFIQSKRSTDIELYVTFVKDANILLAILFGVVYNREERYASCFFDTGTAGHSGRAGGGTGKSAVDTAVDIIIEYLEDSR